MHGHGTTLIDLTPGRAGRVTLLCLPYAGGGTSAFHGWGDVLPDDVRVVAARLPGRESRLTEPPLRDVRAVVAALAAEAGRLAAGPYAVFGHSMGALIGYELVRALRAAGRPEPECLVVSGHSAPQCSGTVRRLHRLPDDELVAALRDYGGTPEALLSSPELMDLFLPTLRADFAVAETYAHTPGPPLSCPMAVFGGERDAEVAPPALRAWAELTAGGCDLRVFPGGHFFVFENRDRVLAELAAILRRGRSASHAALPSGEAK
ncbi:thioesterase II family protein [Actinomadura verrucosospora]|uniref:Erythronolide synthase n=1 Tax=Actinomadura verrucosospora TaxID=46165 RepID=A0A7D3VSP8_ACTVE|nr:alpha/beta fold hydrolase [Actinomadura verrucosospora]QKG19894.1 erythronolide synthase [Actinomadura verrucosospora]